MNSSPVPVKSMDPGVEIERMISHSSWKNAEDQSSGCSDAQEVSRGVTVMRSQLRFKVAALMSLTHPEPRQIHHCGK